jgi:hypothetical protein
MLPCVRHIAAQIVSTIQDRSGTVDEVSHVSSMRSGISPAGDRGTRQGARGDGCLRQADLSPGRAALRHRGRAGVAQRRDDAEAQNRLVLLAKKTWRCSAVTFSSAAMRAPRQKRPEQHRPPGRFISACGIYITSIRMVVGQFEF